MSDDLVKRLRESGSRSEVELHEDREEAAARNRELEADVKAVLRREHDANKKAFEHLRRAEKAEIVSKNYAAFNREWRKRAEAAEAKLAKAVDVDMIEQAISDVMSEGGTYRDAAEYVARTTLAELKGQDDE